MSQVFRHGRLRLYLLKLLDEAPRHGYEVIRLLQDRFMGVYAPSPGTIYPRLARLEEEGLVAHEEANGRKIYRITDKGREELRRRLDDLTELEEEIAASVHDIAREVTEDVRETLRSLREELTSAARDIRERTQSGGRAWDEGGPGWGGPREQMRRAREEARRRSGEDRPDPGRAWREEETRERGRDRRDREGGRGERHEHSRDEHSRDEHSRGEHSHGHSRGERGGAWDEGWGAWARWPGWRGWPAMGPQGCADPQAYRDLEGLAKGFTRNLWQAVTQAQAISEDAVQELRVILDETIERVRTEVFGGMTAHHQPDQPSDADSKPAPGDERTEGHDATA
ncbi:MAG TPA: PadR family transcriptional regulator [Streptosporangiaceae bacterium]|nr:PadR family transcriptional regulator [Streptosporangiaceae bacterium]